MNLKVILPLVLLSHFVFSQERSIIGRVVESGTEKPVRDVNINVTSTTISTLTNHLGYFEVSVDRSQHTTLLISHITFKIVEMPIPAADRFKIYLEKDTILLNILNLNQYPKPATSPEVKSNYDSLAIESSAMFQDGIESFYTYMGNVLAPALPQVNTTGFSVAFTINETGQAVDLSISDSSPEVKAAITQAIGTMPDWTPATQRRKNVKQSFILPIKRFTIPDPQSLDFKELNTFIQKNIKYPAQAKRMGIEGPIFMQFTTDELGDVISIVLLKGINDYCNDEVKRVISIIPAAYLKSLVDKTEQKNFILPVFFGLDRALKTGRDYAPNSSAYMLPAIDVMAGGLTIQRRELGNGAARTVSGPMYRPEPVLITFTALGDALLAPKNVQRLSLRNNELSAFPMEILALTSLSFLDLENNQLTALPDDINVLADLRELYLLNNKFTSLPNNFSSLKKLRTLGLANNKFGSFPHSIISLEKLEMLDLSSNKLTSIPPEIGLMKNLKTLILINNKITALPPEFFTLKKLEKIYLDGNPINSNDIELLKKTFKKAEIGF